MSVKFKLDSRAIPDGTILLFGICYIGADPDGYQRPADKTKSKVYTYAMLKAGGFWYVTGGGKTPQAAGWGAVERWLERDGRVVEWVRHVTETGQLWPPVAPQGPDGTGDQVEDTTGSR